MSRAQVAAAPLPGLRPGSGPPQGGHPPAPAGGGPRGGRLTRAPAAFLKPQALPATTPRIGGITMEDLSARLEQLLSDPQMLSQLGELAAGLGLGNRRQYPVPRLRSRPVGPHRPGDVLPFYPGPRYPAFDGFAALLRGAPPQKGGGGCPAAAHHPAAAPAGG